MLKHESPRKVCLFEGGSNWEFVVDARNMKVLEKFVCWKGAQIGSFLLMFTT